MFKLLKMKLLIVFSLTAAFTVLSFSPGIAAGQQDPFSEIKDKVAGISQKERETIERLFIQAQKIEEMETEERRISSQMDALRKEILVLQKNIEGEEAAYAKKKDTLRLVLSSYQRMGPGSYLEILLNSENLPDLLMRINTLRDLTRNTGALLEEIQESREKQSKEKAVLSEKLEKVEESRKQLEEALAKNRKLRADMESYLASLEEEREHYQGYLDNIRKVWGELKPFFSNVIREFSAFIEKGSLTEDDLEIAYNFFTIRVSIDQKILNDLIKENPKLPEMTFGFSRGKAEMRVPEKNLVLEGNFVVDDENSLRFDVEKGSFYGLPLEAGSIKELFQENDLILNFKSQLGGSEIKAIEIKDGYLEITIKP